MTSNSERESPTASDNSSLMDQAEKMAAEAFPEPMGSSQVHARSTYVCGYVAGARARPLEVPTEKTFRAIRRGDLSVGQYVAVTHSGGGGRWDAIHVTEDNLPRWELQNASTIVLLTDAPNDPPPTEEHEFILVRGREGKPLDKPTLAWRDHDRYYMLNFGGRTGQGFEPHEITAWKPARIEIDNGLD